MNYFDEDGFGSRHADALLNESYYSGIEDEPVQDVRGLMKEEEEEMTIRLAQLMYGIKIK